MTYFHALRTHKIFQMAGILSVLALATLVPAMAQREGGKDDPDRAVKGGGLPAGWSVRPDRGAADQVKFSIAGEVYHFNMGSAATFYRADWTKSGNYTF